MEDSDDATMTYPSITNSKAEEKQKAIALQIEQTPVLNYEAGEILQENSKDKLLKPDVSCEQLNKEGEKGSSPEADLGKNEEGEISEVSHKKAEKQLSDSKEALLDKVERVSAKKVELEEDGESHLNEQINVDLVKLSESYDKIASFGQPSNLQEEIFLIMGKGSTEKGKELDKADIFVQEKFAETVSEIVDPGLNVPLNDDSSQVDEEEDNVSSYEVVFLKGDGEKEEAILELADEVMQENAVEKLQDSYEAHLNGGSPQVAEKNDRKIKLHETLAVKDTKVLSLDNVVGERESFHKAGEIMLESVEEKHLAVPMSCITKKPILKHEKLSTMHNELGTEVEKPFFLKEEGETNSTCKLSVPKLHGNEVKEQYIEKRNASLLVQLVTKDDNDNPIGDNFVSNDDNHLHINDGLATKSEIYLSINSGIDNKENDKNDQDKHDSLSSENLLDKGINDTEKQEEVEEMDIGVNGPAAAAGKRSAKIPKKQKGDQPKQSKNKIIRTHKPKEDESLCFICYDGGDLVLCDHRSCPKVYHPLCINRDEAYFKAKGRWTCGWHICDNCGKSAHHMCYTCAHSLCKGCLRKAEYEFVCVRENKGFCQYCIDTVMMIETKKGAEQTMEKGVVDGLSLFKDYWEEVNEKLFLTVEELTRASTLMKEPNVASAKKKETLNKIRACKREVEPSENEPENTNEGQIGSSSRRLKRNRETTAAGIKKLKKQLKRSKNKHTAVEWASKELLDFVAHMKGGDKSELSQFDVQDLLLAYIKQNNLRDPSKKSQIICDARLLNLFGKERVGHLEMLKIIESHFLVKEASTPATDENQGGVVDPEPNQIDTEGISDTNTKSTSDRKKKLCTSTVERLTTNVEEYAAIDAHNVSKMYLRRSLIENLLDDADTFDDNVVGAFVRIRINGSSSHKDTYKETYRLVQVVGTGKAADIYHIGKKTSDKTLEVLNLSRREFLTIDLISDQEFTEEECKRLRQSIRCGLIKRLTVAQAQEKANILHAVKVNDLLESEKLRYRNLRDRASEQGRTKEHRLSIEKLQLLSRPEEYFKRLNKHPEIHVDPNTDLDYTSPNDDEDQNAKSRDKNKSSNVSFRDSRKYIPIPNNEISNARQVNSPITPKSYAHTTTREPVQSSTNSPETLSQVPTVNETEKIWHYQDPAGKIQGPFSLTVLRKWNANKFFPANLQIWRTSEKQEDSILLTDALDGKINSVSKHPNANQSTNTGALNDTSSSTRKFQQRDTHSRENNSRWNGGDNNNAWSRSPHSRENKSRWNGGDNNNAWSRSPHSRENNSRWNGGDNNNAWSRSPHSRENNSRWNGGHNHQNNWNSNRNSNIPDRRFQSSNNNRGFGRHNSYQDRRNQQFPAQQMKMQPSNVATNQPLARQQGNNIDWALLQGAINNILPSSTVNPAQPSQLVTTANVNATKIADQAVSLNAASNAPVSLTFPDASVQQQQQITNGTLLNVIPQQMNMGYSAAAPNAANMNWGMTAAQAPMNMNMNWGAVGNTNMGWGVSAQLNMNPSLGWVVPPQGTAMQVNPTPNPGWVAPAVGFANPNDASPWVAPQALGNSAYRIANYQANLDSKQ